MRSLLDCEGPVETARQCSEAGQFDDRRIDQVVNELERYRMALDALILLSLVQPNKALLSKDSVPLLTLQ